MKKKIIRITTVSRSLNKLLGAQIDYVKEYYDLVLVSQNDDNGLIKLGKEKNLPVFAINFTRRITPFKDLLALYRLIKFIKKENPDIVHTHTPKAGLIGILAAKASGVKHRLHTVAGLPLLEAHGLKYKILVYMERLLYASATKVYFNSRGLMNIVIDKKICKTSKKFRIIENGSTNGVDTNFFSSKHFSQQELQKLRSDNNIKLTDVVFLFIGRIVKDKGVNELVTAFKKLSSEYNDIQLVMLGRFEGDLNPVSKEVTKEIEENPKIKFLGYKNDVRPYFAFSDIFVFPSYREGFPNVVMQAGAMGLPSIVSNINGNNEIIEEGVNGAIIPVKDAETLYETMKTWYKNPDFVLKLKKKSFQIVKDKYDQKLVLEGVLNEYKSLS